MAQTVFLTTPPLGFPSFHSVGGGAALGVPLSPDPTPLRMLAFSVAEAALENDPNSPSFLHVLREDPAHMASIDAALSEAAAALVAAASSHHPAATATTTIKSKRWSGSDWQKAAARTNLWDVAEKAKDRRQVQAPATSAGRSPPCSPAASYNFTLPAHSPLAASIDRASHQSSATARRATLETRSAEPSPTSLTFAGLDQSRPPPEFVPRLSAEEFSAQSKQVSSTKHVRTKSDESLSAVMAKSTGGKARGERMKIPLPSLKQIQAKLSQERKGSSSSATSGRTQEDGAGSPERKLVRPNGGVLQRTNSDDSVEVLVTPSEERPSLAILSRRPSTPPASHQAKKAQSPPTSVPRLAPFLRERTNDRLALASGSSACSIATPPANKPVLTVTPPSCERRQAATRLDLQSPSRCTSAPPLTPLYGRRAVTTPVASRFPPLSDLARYSPRTPSSPTTSSASGPQSPSMMPIITCTPAPAKIVKDGVEMDSDEEGDEVVVFDGEQEEARERLERERRSAQMKERLSLRRGSD